MSPLKLCLQAAARRCHQVARASWSLIGAVLLVLLLVTCLGLTLLAMGASLLLMWALAKGAR